MFASLLTVAAEVLQLDGAIFQAGLHDVADELLFDLQQLIEIAVGDLRLDHPELGQVAARLALLRAERRPEAVHALEGEDVGLVVQLAGLRQVRLLLEVFHREQRGGAFGGGGREDGRGHFHAAVIVQPLRAWRASPSSARAEWPTAATSAATNAGCPSGTRRRAPWA